MTKRTSFTQFAIMVEYMERHGDLSKISGGARGRLCSSQKWRDLVMKLNSDRTGKTASEEKWRKAWSDFKNNTKKKWAKIKKSVNRTGGGCPLKMILTDLEHRVLAIIGEQAATGMQDVQEVDTTAAFALGDTEKASDSHEINLTEIEDWNVDGPSQQQQSRACISSPRVAKPLQSSTPLSYPSTPSTPRQTQAHPMLRNKRPRNVEEIFLRIENNARDDNKHRDQMEIEKERNRLRESELQLKRDELELKSQFLNFMKEALHCMDRFLNSNE